MSKELKNISLILLVVLVLYPFIYGLGSYFILLRNKMIMIEQLEGQSLETLQLSNSSNYYWVEDKKELSINGQLFDVHSFEQRGNMLIVCGLFDKKEDAIKRKVADFLKMNNGGNTNSNVTLSFYGVFNALPPSIYNLVEISEAFSNVIRIPLNIYHLQEGHEYLFKPPC